MCQEEKCDRDGVPVISDKLPSVPLQPVVRPLPCPFCGSYRVFMNHIIEPMVRGIAEAMKCADCSAQGPIMGSSFGERTPTEQRELAERGWNCRSNPTGLETVHKTEE